MKIVFMVWEEGAAGPMLEAPGREISLLCDFVEELGEEGPAWLEMLRSPVSVVEYKPYGGRREGYSPSEAAACFRRLRGLAAEHGKKWTTDERWPKGFWDAAELLDWLDSTLEMLERQPPEMRIKSIEQHG